MAQIPDSVRLRFRNMLEESKGHERFKKMLGTGNVQDFKWAYELSMAYGHGKPPQTVEMEVNDITQRPSYEELQSIRDRLAKDRSRNGVDSGK